MTGVRRVLRRALSSIGRTLFGPWPIYPTAMALIAVYGLFISAGSRTQVGNRTAASYFEAVLPQWASIVLTCLIIYILLRTLSALVRPLRPVEESRLAYCGVLLASSALTTLMIVVMTQLTVDDRLRETLPPLPTRYALSIPVVGLVLFIGNGAIAQVRTRLALQERLLAQRVDVLRSERTLLLEAEEQVRSQASRTLHDNIQAALLRAVVRLEGLRDRLDDDDRRRFDASMAEIETVREDRVRALGRVLAPAIGDIGLLQALEELGGFYADVMRVEFECSAGVRERFQPVGDQDPKAMAVYRINEQLLLNALKHGRATTVHVTLDDLSDGRIRVIVTADGQSPSATAIAGTGTATINSWLDVTGGTWEIGPGDDGSGSRAVVVVGH